MRGVTGGAQRVNAGGAQRVNAARPLGTWATVGVELGFKVREGHGFGYTLIRRPARKETKEIAWTGGSGKGMEREAENWRLALKAEGIRLEGMGLKV